MVRRKVKLEEISEIQEFNRICFQFDCDMDLVGGKYYVDAKSIMGIFSLDLSKPIDLNIHADGAALDNVMQIISKYTID